MKEFLTYNWKTITLTILGVIFVYLLVRVFTPVKDMSELNKYKLEQIDTRTEEIKKLQKDGPPTLYEYYNVMLDRCEDMIVNTPVDWDGVYIATSK